MSTSAEEMQGNPQLDAWLDKKLDELLPKKLEEIDAAKTPSMAIIATKGTLDWAYPPFILASTAAALGWDTKIFFTFYGLLLLKKELPCQVSPLGNPAMPMKDPPYPSKTSIHRNRTPPPAQPRNADHIWCQQYR